MNIFAKEVLRLGDRKVSECWSGLILIAGLVVWFSLCVSDQLKVTVANPANLAETGKVAGHTSMVYECETSQRDTKTRLIRHGGDHGESRSYLQVQREKGMPGIDDEDDGEHGTGLEQ